MMQSSLAPTQPAAPRGSGETFPSPLFREVAARFQSNARCVILETGMTSGEMVSLLEGKRCRLLVAGAARALSALSEQALDADSVVRKIDSLVIDAGTEPIDVALCWDLLNYLTPPLLKAFATRLMAIMTPTGVVHAYIHSAHATMPRHPQRYKPLGADLMVRVEHETTTRKAPRYSTHDLEKHAVGLRVERSMLLRNGMQEYLLRLDPSRSGPREVKALYRKRPAKV